ncbi:MAG: hypothetical protein IT431_01700 [Phycisphaerales bacterium]|nr:hypothetical protein [Phycisphaerales bacterium]
MTHQISRLLGLAPIALASAAMAQGTMTFSWTVGDTGDSDGVIVPGESAVLTLWAQWDPRQIGYAGSIFDIVGNADWQLGTISNYENLVDSLDTGPGTLHGDNSITGIQSFQLPPLFNPQFRDDYPLAIYRLEWTPQEYEVYWVEFTSANHLHGSVYTNDFGSSEEYQLEVLGGRIVVVPGPGGLAVLGVAGLAGARRR